jgi:hypothetical protein
MLLDLTPYETEIVFELVHTACPDHPARTEREKTLEALCDFLEWKLGYSTTEPAR